MQTSLFQNSSFISQPTDQSNTITEEKIVKPLVQVLEQVSPKTINHPAQSNSNSYPIKQSLEQLFPEQQYNEKNIRRAKEILGSKADAFTDDQLRDTVTEIQYLTDTWLDDFEKGIFGGLTLQELLHEKGGQ